MELEWLHIVRVDEVGKLPPDKFVRIFTEELPAGDVDLSDAAVFIEAGISDRREIVQVGIAHSRVCQLLLCGAQFSILNLEFELMNLKLFNQVMRCLVVRLGCFLVRTQKVLESFEQFMSSHSLVQHWTPT